MSPRINIQMRLSTMKHVEIESVVLSLDNYRINRFAKLLHMWCTCVLRFSQFELMTARMAVKAAKLHTPLVSLNLTNRSLYLWLLYKYTRILTLLELNYRPGVLYSYSETSPNATLPFWLIWRIAYLTIEVSLSRWDCTSIATRSGRGKNSIAAI